MFALEHFTENLDWGLLLQSQRVCALARVAQVVGHHPVHRKVAGLGSQCPIGSAQEAVDRYFTLTSMFLSFPLPLSFSKNQLKLYF